MPRMILTLLVFVVTGGATSGFGWGVWYLLAMPMQSVGAPTFVLAAWTVAVVVSAVVTTLAVTRSCWEQTA